jgi:hypothetical protein
MSKMKRVLFRLVVVGVFAAGMFPLFMPANAASSGPIIADHTVVDQYDEIPQYWLDQVKKMFLNTPGESHSTTYGLGLDLLEAQDPNYRATNYYAAQPPPENGQGLRVSRWIYGNDAPPNNPTLFQFTGEAQWYTWHAWDPAAAAENVTAASNAVLIKNHIAYTHDNSIEITAIGFGWCWDMSWRNSPGGEIDPEYGVRWAGSSVGGPVEGTESPGFGQRWGLNDADTALTGNPVNMDDYLAATEEYIAWAETNSPNTRVFFTTGAVDWEPSWVGHNNSERGYQREIKQQYIRDYVNANDKILFDYADILTHNDAGELYTETWNGHEYPQLHPDNMKALDGTPRLEGYHTGEVGALRLAKAMWWLLARLAGWDGNPVPAGDTEAPSVTVISPNGGEQFKKDLQYDITWTAQDNVGVTSVDIAYSWDAGASYSDIATGLPYSGSYTWTAPDNPSATTLVKVTARDAAGNLGSDASDAAFNLFGAIPGDANDDCVVNPEDITRTAEIILGIYAPTRDADANGDSNTDVLDITKIEMILGP